MNTIFDYPIHILTYFDDKTIDHLTSIQYNDKKAQWMCDMLNDKDNNDYMPSLQDIFMISTEEEIEEMITPMGDCMKNVANHIKKSIGLFTKKEAKKSTEYIEFVKKILTIPDENLKVEALKNLPTIKPLKTLIPKLYLYLITNYPLLVYSFGLDLFTHYTDKQLRNIIVYYMNRPNEYLQSLYERNKRVIIERIKHLTNKDIDPWNDTENIIVSNKSVIGINYYEYNSVDIVIIQLDNKIGIYDRRELACMKITSRCIHTRQKLNEEWIEYMLRWYNMFNEEFGEFVSSIEENIKELI